ncbi:ATP-binding protein [Pseudomonas chengduensis]
MIRGFYISGFKSLVDFKMRLSPFNCLVGLNGAGKSTVLQAFDFISAIHQGRVSNWLESRRWQSSDLSFHGSRKQLISVQISFNLGATEYIWTAGFNKLRNACTYEMVTRYRIVNGEISDEVKLLQFHEGKYKIFDQEAKVADFVFEGSIMSQLRSDVLGKELPLVSMYLSNIRSMDLLSPHLIRQKSRAAFVPDIGYGGEKLSVFVHGLSPIQKHDLVEKVKRFNPRVEDINTTKIRGGMVKIEVVESLSDRSVFSTEVRHVNDGLLRLLAIIAQQYSDNTFVLYDEIENGVNPEVTQSLVRALMDSPKQSLVTTHSPVVLNFLSDQEAVDSVTLIYKRDDGITRAIKLFDIPMIKDKLDFLAPGEAVIDLPHAALAEEAEAILLERESKEE